MLDLMFNLARSISRVSDVADPKLFLQV